VVPPSRAVGERTAENSLEKVVFGFSVIFLQKGIYRSALGPYNPPPPTGCGASECGDADWTVKGFGPQVL
jgi:hypothetical protein